jgi:hypothetical protein
MMDRAPRLPEIAGPRGDPRTGASRIANAGRVKAVVDSVSQLALKDDLTPLAVSDETRPR